MQYNVKWRNVKGYKGIYEASELGQIRQKPKEGTLRGKIIEPFLRRGYLWIELWKDGVGKRHLLHVLVANTFLKPDPDRLFINHLNGIKYDNRLVNLERCTNHENILHAIEVGLSPKAYPAKCPDKTLLAKYNRQTKVVQFSEDGHPIAVFATIKEAAMSVNTSSTPILKALSDPNKKAANFYWETYRGEPLHWTRDVTGAFDERRMTCLFGVGI